MFVTLGFLAVIAPLKFYRHSMWRDIWIELISTNWYECWETHWGVPRQMGARGIYAQ